MLQVQTLQMKPFMTYDIGRNRTMSTKEQIYIGAKVQKCKSRKQSVCEAQSFSASTTVTSIKLTN